MTKADLVSRVNDAAALSAVESTAFINAFQEVVSAELAAGGEVPMPGFGKLSVKARPARKGRNPRIPACRTAKFAPAKALKDALN